MKTCGIEVRFRDGKTERFQSLSEAKYAVQTRNESAVIEDVCTLSFCIAGKCQTIGRRRRKRR